MPQKIIINNLIGKRFSNITILSFAYRKGCHIMVNCKCSCGTEKIYDYHNIKGGRTTSCGCIRKLKIDNYIGMKFKNLSIIKHVQRGNMVYVDCKCDCGNIKTNIYLGNLTNGNITSCGCNRKKSIGKAKTHGDTIALNGGKTRLYRIRSGMRGRCNRATDSCYKYYGARGIQIEWKSYQKFKEDMFESYLHHVYKYGEKDTTIERIDVNGNYCKDNCTWITRAEQQNNRRDYILKDQTKGFKYNTYLGYKRQW